MKGKSLADKMGSVGIKTVKQVAKSPLSKFKKAGISTRTAKKLKKMARYAMK